jgi:hypothetical protein
MGDRVTPPRGAGTASQRSARSMAPSQPTATVAPADQPSVARAEAGTDGTGDESRGLRAAIADAAELTAATVGLLVLSLRLWDANLRQARAHEGGGDQ